MNTDTLMVLSWLQKRVKSFTRKASGLANMEWEIPNQPDTKHRLASVTKQFTAMLIVQLAAEDKIDLDLPISSYLPDYPKTKGDSITVHHLLTHTSGTPNYTSFSNYRQTMLHHNSREELVSLFADSALNFTPGERFEYSNSGYVLLGAIIESVTGKSYEQSLQEKIFTPLNMVNTGYDHNSTVLKNRASGYYKNGNSFVNANYINMSTPYAAGALYSTVEDLYLWDQALHTNALLPENYGNLLFKKHVPDGEIHYGYGWEIDSMPLGNTTETLQTVRHGGGINGFNTLITRIPSNNTLVLLLSNTGRAPLYAMTVAINGILYDKPYDLPKQSIATLLFDAIEKNGISKALSYYNEIINSNDYYLNENEMNIVGYDLLYSDRVKEAVSVFQLNVEAFPNSFNVYDSYGEALLVLGDRAQAIENYKKSIELNPRNENGLKVLRNLGVKIEP